MYRIALSLVLLVAAALPAGIHAQAYPSKPVRVIVPQGPGDSCDVLTRLIVPSEFRFDLGSMRHRTNAIASVLVATVLFTSVRAVSATTYMSVEPIPNRDIVGQDKQAIA